MKIGAFFTVIACMALGISLVATATDKSPSKPKGRFVMDGANCAGLDFVSETEIKWVNELGCSSSTWRSEWINDVSFFMVETEQHTESCPPRVSVYTVLSFDGTQLKLEDHNTLWGNFPSEVLVFKYQGR